MYSVIRWTSTEEELPKDCYEVIVADIDGCIWIGSYFEDHWRLDGLDMNLPKLSVIKWCYTEEIETSD